MIIKRSINKDGNLYPKALNAVKSIPDSFVYSKDYYLRKPHTILNLSYQRIFKAFSNTLELEFNLRQDIKKDGDILNHDFDKLGSFLIELFDSINSFIEDCLHIFKSTTPSSQEILSIDRKFVSQWLKKANHPTFEKFFNSIKDYRDEITYYTNHIKHEHGRIDILVGKSESDLTLGYTMKFMGDTPSGPLEILDLNKVKCIILDLNYHFFQVYRISDSFSNELINSIRFYHTCDVALKPIEKEFPELDIIIEKLKINKLLVFPNNEIITPKVLIQFQPSFLKLEYPFGITDENTKHIKYSKIKGEEYKEQKLLIIPTKRTLKLFKNAKDGDQIRLSLDDNRNFLKIFIQITSLTNKKGTYLKLNYDNFLEVETYTNMSFSQKFNSDTVSDLHVKIPKINYFLTKN